MKTAEIVERDVSGNHLKARRRRIDFTKVGRITWKLKDKKKQ